MALFRWLAFILLMSCSTGPNPGTGSATPKPTTPSKAACQFRSNVVTSDQNLIFSQSDKIVLVSYPVRTNALQELDLIINNRFRVDNVLEEIVLSRSQKDSLHSILFNYTSEIPANAMDCYNPRHSIVFYENDVPKAFLEVCFECQKMVSTPGMDFGVICEDKMCILEGFFKNAGVKSGLYTSGC